MKTKILFSIAFFIFFPFILFSQSQIGSDIDGEAAEDISGRSVSLSSDGSIVAIGAFGNDGNGTSSGHVRVYQNTGGVWTQIGSDIDGEAINDQSGISVSLSSDGSIVAIGASLNDENGNNSGHVRVYQNIGGVWTQTGSDIDGEQSGDLSGRSVSLSSDGSIVAIGAPNNDDNAFNSGDVQVYQNIGGVWTQIGSDINGEAASDFSGSSVSLSSDGSIVAIGANNNDGNGTDSGHVRVYQNTGGVWIQIGSDIDGEAVNDRSGRSVSLSSDGSIVAIGAGGNDGNSADSGHVRVYQNTGGVWTQIGSDIDGEAADDQSGGNASITSDGSSVSLSSDGGIVAIGAESNDGNGTDSGHVRVYQNIGGVWTQIGIDIDGEAADDQSGRSVSLSSDGSIIAIGADNNDGNGNISGQVRVYDLSALLSSNSFVLSQFNIFPNPTNDIVSFSDNSIKTVTVYDINGRKVLSTTNSNSFSVKTLAKGIYIVKAIGENNAIATKKLIKN
jgi:hypothetical protein